MDPLIHGFTRMALAGCGREGRGFKYRSLSMTIHGNHRRDSSSTNPSFDVVVVGGGIVGVAAAREILLQKPHLTCAIVEKEPDLGCHQSSHNSGVIHAALYERGLANKVQDMRVIEKSEISSVEKYCVGIKALHSPHTGIVDWGLVTKSFGEDFKEVGGAIIFNYELSSFSYGDSNATADIAKYPIELISEDKKKVNAGYVLCCGGLFADRIAKLTGGSREPVVLPVRGEFLELVEEKRYLIQGNIYPVPNPKFPFLGVHFTPRIDGKILVGPNAVLAFSREGYSYSDVSIADCMEYLRYPGFRKLALNNASFGVEEFFKSMFLQLQLKKLRQFIPQITAVDLKKGPSGVRAQALNLNGELVEDFVFDGGDESNPRILHCRNAPSPAATSSLAIAQVLADKMFEIMAK
ncbi:FAD dependent oxidoreductase [Nesidiocoris tenuis]|uniref:L-2-hydroxyglutarate dehydrogenase, mitochondrial n=1 Tax=Nesidiocoris tenuis TaxID=355587 RepID=A0ABN7A7L6_9HEMI|nr:FAD dependent oxidoreductase [Nesidiocoris tenuis]